MASETGSPQSGHLKKESWRTVLTLAYQSLGVVYGDLSTSPLYVYKSTFAEDIHHSETNEEIYGVLSLVFWTLTLVPLVKYVLIVLRADDNGEGGTFALYSLLCRRARVNSLSMADSRVADEEVPGLTGSTRMARGIEAKLRSTVERSGVLQRLLLVLALVGACMVIGDGILMPSISVFSAVSGLEPPKEHHKYVEVPVACVILIGLFALQHYGTHRVGFLFAPVVAMWLICISAIGLYNILRWDPHIFRALSPQYIYIFLEKTRRKGWLSLGGVLLCITGSEAMFADLGHFSQLSIKMAFTSMVYPSLILAYMGQAAYLSRHHSTKSGYNFGFYASVPEALRLPVLVIAILAAVVGSQAMITGTFSIIKQCSALGCFPKVKIVHTSSRIHGQIYIPEINWILMILCLAVTIGFRDTKRIGNASGLAVITVMLVTTCLMFLVIVLCWQKSILIAVCFVLVFGTIEVLFFSASLIKFLEGAWLPIVLGLILLTVMYLWHYGTLKVYEYEFQSKVSIDWLLGLGPTLGITRVRGIGIIHSELVSGIPAIFSHFVTNLPAFHQVLVFLCIKSVPIPHVRPEERFLVSRIGQREHRIYRCVVCYGYRDVHKDDIEFERDLVRSIAEFIHSGGMGSADTERSFTRDNNMMTWACSSRADDILMSDDENGNAASSDSPERKAIHLPPPQVKPKKRVRFIVPEGTNMELDAKEELSALMEAREAGIAYILGHCYVRAKRGSSLLRKVAINVGYEFLRRNCRERTHALDMPHASSIEVGMFCHI